MKAAAALPSLVALALTLPAAPALALTGGSAEASGALAKRLGAQRAVFYLEAGKVLSEDWLLPGKGWPRAKAHDAIRAIAGVEGAFAKREVKGGNEWLTPRAGVTAVLHDAATTEGFSVSRTGYEYKPKGREVMLYLAGHGLRRQGPSPENVALIRPGMDVDTAATLLGPWDLPAVEIQHEEVPAFTWHRAGKPAVRLHVRDGQVTRVETL